MKDLTYGPVISPIISQTEPSPGLPDKLGHLPVKTLLVHQALQRDMHPITPIIGRDGRNIYTLRFGIGPLDRIIDSKPILQWDNRQHRAGLQVVGDNLTRQFRRQFRRCRTKTTKHLVVITLGLALILFPPASQGRHIVSRGRTNRMIRQIKHIGKLPVRRLRHPFHLQAKDLFLMHDLRNRSRDHTQILSAD